jgi:aconitate hydratase
MAATLTATVLDSHRAPERRPAWGRSSPAARVALKPDHVVLEGEGAALTLQLFETLGEDRFACELVLVSGTEHSLRHSAASADLLALERHARRHGAVFSRLGNGPGHQVYGARFGAPGRLVFGTERRIAGAGALCALALVVTPVEAAAALAGFPLEWPAPEVTSIRLAGKPPGWLTGEDLVLELTRRMHLRSFSAAARPRQVLEFQVLEPEALTYAMRSAMATRAHEVGALAVLFPSDETTRRFLRAQGREPDWKPLVADRIDRISVELDFANFEPLLARSGEVVRLQDLSDAPVVSVWVGPEASLADLARFRQALAQGSVNPGLECVITPGNRQVQETAARDGLLRALASAGASIRLEAATIPRPRGGGLSLACGVPLAAGQDGWQIAGVASCAAAAAHGRVADPRALPAESANGQEEAYVVNDRLLVRPAPESEASGADRKSALALSPGIRGPLRGVILLAVGDHVGAAHILPWGARVRPHALQIEALAGFAFAGLDPTFVARARAEGGGFLVAGSGLGAGERREQVAMILVALGIRGILARSFDAEFRRQLRQHGVLSLRFGTEADADTVRVGDELEIPDLPEGLEPGKPLVVRDLTRGAPCTVHHDLDESGVMELRAGGLLAALRGRRRGV